MEQSKLTKALKDLRDASIKHSPEILTGIGIAGMITTTILAVRATPKALIILEDARDEKGEELNNIEKVKAAWKPYIPTVITGVTSIACLISANSVNARRNAALATAYNISRNALAEYKEKVIETIGDKKELKIREAINQDKIESNPVSKNEVYITSNGDNLCYDTLSGRYFKSEIDKIDKAVNKLNKRMISEMYISLSEFYDAIGLDHTKTSDYLGWNIDREGFIDIDYGANIADDGQPCVVVDYSVGPTYDFDKLS